MRQSLNHLRPDSDGIAALPGGLLRDSQLYRDYKFKTLTGCQERHIKESGIGLSTLAQQITKILAATMETVAGLPATEEVVWSLSSGDRQFLMNRLQSIIEPMPKWITTSCKHCKELIQYQLAPQMMPVKIAGENYPEHSVSLTMGDVQVRVPTGADEEAVANASENKLAFPVLVDRLVSTKSQKVDVDSLSEEDLLAIDQFLEDMNPQLGESVSINCPYCNSSQEYLIDHYSWIIDHNRDLDDEIHTLAFHYHWSEKEILSLPKQRRQHYVTLIEKSLGRNHAADNYEDVWDGRQ